MNKSFCREIGPFRGAEFSIRIGPDWYLVSTHKHTETLKSVHTSFRQMLEKDTAIPANRVYQVAKVLGFTIKKEA